MYKTYTHYGIEVVRQVTGTPFTSSLSNAGIDYVELPVITPLVVMYTKDEVKKYAVIVPCSIPDDYQEIVYVTTEIPADLSWTNLIDDVEAQHLDGAAPKIMQSRLRIMLETAYEKGLDTLGDRYPITNIPSHPIIPDEVMCKFIKRRLIHWGCDFTSISAPADVDPEYLRSIVNA